ncbi:MAG: hypothetical protein V4576_00260 [Patescibacteria group bacterium]
MNPNDYKGKKNANANEEAARIEELKKKLYSNSSRESNVRERGLRQHHIDIGKSWDETDKKQAHNAALKAKEKEDARLGLSNENITHRNSTLYGHFSPVENATQHKQQVKTSIDNSADQEEGEDMLTTIFGGPSGQAARKRAEQVQKRLAAKDVTMKYASAQIQGNIYPDFQKQKAERDAANAAAAAEAAKNAPVHEPITTERYHPDFSVLTVGNTNLDKMTREVHHTAPVEKTPEEESAAMPSGQKHEPIFTEERKRVSFGVVFFMLILGFFLSALGYAYYTLTHGTNIISPDKVAITVQGPVSVRSGEVNDFSIDITNNNPTDLTLSDLVIQYPAGTMSAIEPAQSHTYERMEVGTIKSGETVHRKASAIFFGEENVKKNINYAVEFSIPDSTSIFNVTKDVGVIIAGSPITAKITNVKEVTNNQELSFDIEIQSNTQEVVKNIQLQVEYPFGYKLEQANLKPVFDNNTWNIGDLAALDSKVIQLKGKLIGTSNLEKNFRFVLGVYDPKTGDMSTVLSTQDQKVVIAKPFVSTKLSLDGQVQEYRPVQYDDSLQGDIVFTNNLDVPLTNVVVEMSVGGVLIDRRSIEADKGFYQSSNDLVFWDKAQNDTLAEVAPGQSRELGFNLKIISARDNLIKSLRRAGSNLVVTVKAKRLNQNRVPEEVTSVINQEIRLTTNPTFESGIGFSSGPFTNSGSYPPKVNSETTYTYTGRISNTANSLKQTIFTAKLPPNGTWKNVYSKDIPSDAISYSQSKREITIDLGEIPSGAGIDVPAKEFSFQVGFTPTLTEVGKAPVLIIAPHISGVDSFTGERLDRGLDGLNILPTLDSESLGDGRVVE